MFFDRMYSKYYAKKRRRRNAAIAWTLGAVAAVALMPLAFKRDKKKGEWGIASLLLFVGCKPSEQVEGKRDITISIPGYAYVEAFMKDTYSKLFNARKARKAACDCICDCEDDSDFDDLSDILEETEPDIVITAD